MRRACAVAVFLAIAGVAAAQEPEGVPVTDDVVRDIEFGVSARHFGLERRVAMYQWSRSRTSGKDYVQTWSEHAIDSRGFAPGHDNPALPLRSRRWIAAISLDGKPLDTSVIERLGQWRMFRPNFSALPGNLAATFQPEGDGLGSAENPLDPQIGDLRIHWRELTLPPLQGRVVLRDGRWQLSPDAMPNAVPTAEPKKTRVPWLFGGGALIVLIVIAMRRRRGRSPGKAEDRTRDAS